jgi:pyruvate/2-oxoglutarate dehydrogenase complex dihydrolipoamide dehydrogenase (E3) component
MPTDRYDVIVLGGGSAARDGANKAARDYDARVALVERTRWGGSCPNVACKPTKAYLVAADLLRDLRTLGPLIGIDGAPARADLGRIRAWKESLKKSQDMWVDDLRAKGFDTFDGEGELVEPQTVRVGDTQIAADRILVATGSRTTVPQIPGLDEAGWIDHVSALDLDDLPPALLVLGGGPVGLEFAQIFARFGSRVSLVQTADRLAPRADPDAAAELAAALADDGVDVLTGTTVSRFDDGAAVLSDGRRLGRATVFLASGRTVNVERLGLERIGVRVTRAGIQVDERMRTSVDGVWAAGDVTGLAQFTPIAQYQARIAVDDMFGADGHGADYSVLPTAIFTDPELAAVGMTEAEARERGHEVGTATHRIGDVTRSQYVRESHGLYKLVFDRATRRVLGIHVVTRNASDVVQGLAVALRFGVTVDDLAHAHHVYPSWGEGVKGAAEKSPPSDAGRAV